MLTRDRDRDPGAGPGPSPARCQRQAPVGGSGDHSAAETDDQVSDAALESEALEAGGCDAALCRDDALQSEVMEAGGCDDAREMTVEGELLLPLDRPQVRNRES